MLADSESPHMTAWARVRVRIGIKVNVRVRVMVLKYPLCLATIS